MSRNKPTVGIFNRKKLIPTLNLRLVLALAKLDNHTYHSYLTEELRLFLIGGGGVGLYTIILKTHRLEFHIFKTSFGAYKATSKVGLLASSFMKLMMEKPWRESR